MKKVDADVSEGTVWRKDPPLAATLGSPLHWAAEFGNSDAARLFISQGANVHATNAQGETPLHRAAMNDQDGVALVLIENGADVNAKDELGKTPLYEVAQWSDQTAVAEALLSKGADVNAKDVIGSTPLAVAKFCGHKEMANWLTQHGGHE